MLEMERLAEQIARRVRRRLIRRSATLPTTIRARTDRPIKNGLLAHSAARSPTKRASKAAHAFDPNSKRFRNLMSYERLWAKEAGSEDWMIV